MEHGNSNQDLTHTLQQQFFYRRWLTLAPYLLEVSHRLYSHPVVLVGVLGGAGLSCPQSCLSLHQPVALPLQEEFGLLDGRSM